MEGENRHFVQKIGIFGRGIGRAKPDFWRYSGFLHDFSLSFLGQSAIMKIRTFERGNGMKITLNPDASVVLQVREGLKRTGGYCPCRLQRTEENKCMCQEFRDQINDPAFEGFCHCMLYYKSKDAN